MLTTLSHQEYQVLELSAEGLAACAIAHRLDIHPKTVSTYRARAMDKLGVGSWVLVLKEYWLETWGND
jgi:DNA-binding NarL/FixJ family response regulator